MLLHEDGERGIIDIVEMSPQTGDVVAKSLSEQGYGCARRYADVTLEDGRQISQCLRWGTDVGDFEALRVEVPYSENKRRITENRTWKQLEEFLKTHDSSRGG